MLRKFKQYTIVITIKPIIIFIQHIGNRLRENKLFTNECEIKKVRL